MKHQPEPRELSHPAWEAINWNQVPDFDKQIWEKLTSQFWLDTRIPLANDIASWGTLTAEEKTLVMRVFTGLTMLDTVQGRFGADALKRDAISMFEEAIYSNIAFMENVHSKSYSSIFSTLSNTAEINESFRWSTENEFLRKKVDTVMHYYNELDGDELAAEKKKVASVFLESFLFYSGFYLPLYLNSRGKLTNTADLIRLIMRDEAIHGYYIGAKFQEQLNKLSAEKKEEIQDWSYDLLQELYENEIKYTQDLYDSHGMTEEVKAFLRYNGNRALMNLGFDPLFPKEEVNPSILTQMNLSSETHDFFSGAGNSYAVAEVESLNDDDFDF